MLSPIIIREKKFSLSKSLVRKKPIPKEKNKLKRFVPQAKPERVSKINPRANKSKTM
jgi:hypothetical protein